jgi:ABC-2 type transport system ATP-binding protein
LSDGSRNIAISVDNLVKWYRGNQFPALDGISFQIPSGEIYGLLGPNGAGKTTTIHILCGLLSAGSGEVVINGFDWAGGAQAIKQAIGVVPQEIALYGNLTARENLHYIGAMYGLKGQVLRKRIDECLAIFGLDSYQSRLIRTYSGGMKRRINLIAGILHQPSILFLDEPTVGVDVQSRTVILDFLKSLNKEGTTIIYTSHYMEEAEGLCSSIGIIDAGRMICQGRPAELIGSKPEYTNLENIFLHLTGRSLRDS